MENEVHEPTRKEVFGEIGSSVGNSMWNGTKAIGRGLGGFLKNFGKGITFVHVTPTYINNYKKTFSEHREMSVGEGASLIAQGMIYSRLIESIPDNGIYLDSPEVLLIPLATNVASGLYEGVRVLGNKIYNSAEQRVIENKQSKLETGV